LDDAFAFHIERGDGETGCETFFHVGQSQFDLGFSQTFRKVRDAVAVATTTSTAGRLILHRVEIRHPSAAGSVSDNSSLNDANGGACVGDDMGLTKVR